MKMVKTIMSTLGAGLLCCALMALAGCQGEEETTPGDVSEGEVPAGATVTVDGEVARIVRTYDPRTFTVEGEAEIFSEDLVVISKKDLPAALNVDDEVRITGTVHKVGTVEIEKEVGWDFDPEVEVELEDVESYLVADSVEVIEQD